MQKQKLKKNQDEAIPLVSTSRSSFIVIPMRELWKLPHEIFRKRNEAKDHSDHFQSQYYYIY